MLELLLSHRGQQAIRQAVRCARRYIAPQLSSGVLGGTALWIDVTLACPDDTGYRLYEGFVDSGAPDPNHGEFDYREIKNRMRDRSVRTGMSCRDSNELGDICTDDETPYEGNFVLDLTPDGTYKIVVSVAGLSERNNEFVSAHIAYAARLAVAVLLRPKEELVDFYTGTIL